jgi:hypothetical protein
MRGFGRARWGARAPRPPFFGAPAEKLPKVSREARDTAGEAPAHPGGWTASRKCGIPTIYEMVFNRFHLDVLVCEALVTSPLNSCNGR